MTKDIPIIFSGPMVRALLDGRKTMTRRIIKLPTKGEYVRPDMGGWAATTVGGGKSFVVRRDGSREPQPEHVAIWNQTTGTCLATRFQPCQRLWVRETWQLHSLATDFGTIVYRASINQSWTEAHEMVPVANIAGKRIRPKPFQQGWRSALYLFRELSRLTLIVDAVKVERLQAISDDDCLAEGVCPFQSGPTPVFGIKVDGGYEHAGLTPRETYMNLWCSLNGPSAWNDNPFVVAPSFRVIKANIDAAEAQIAA